MKKTPQPIPDLETVPFIDVTDFAACLGVGQGVVYSLVKSGEVQSVRVGRLVRIPTSELHKLAGRTPTA